MLRNFLAALSLLLSVVSADAAARFWVGGTGTWDASDQTHWSSTTGPGNAPQTVPGAGDTVTFDANSGGGTVTVNTTINVTSITMGAFGGTLDFAANDNNVTLVTFSNSGTGTRTFNMGDGTWTITTPSATPWDQGTITNLTFASNASTLVIAPSSARTAQALVNLGASLTYNAITINDPVLASTVERAPILFTSTTNTITTFSITNTYSIKFTGNTTTTITNGFSYSGALGTALLIASTDNNSQATISVGGTVSLEWTAIQNIIKAGAGSITATNSFDLGGNSATITITSPSSGGRIIGG